MAFNSIEREWPIPDAIHQFQIAVVHDNQTEINLLFLSLNQTHGEATLTDRDVAVRSLRFLKFWFNVPCAVFLTATNILDRFLTRMKVQRKYLGCLVISCFFIATKIHSYTVKQKDLIMISQPKCSVKDMERMGEIIRTKLDLNTGKPPLNVFNYLNQFLGLLESIAIQTGISDFFHEVLKKDLLLSHIEVIMCDAECASSKPAIIALTLIQAEFEKFVASDILNKFSYYSYETLQLYAAIVDLQIVCLIKPAEFSSCLKRVTQVLEEYDNYATMRYRQRLQWRFSSRKIYLIRPSWNYLIKHEVILEE